MVWCGAILSSLHLRLFPKINARQQKRMERAAIGSGLGLCEIGGGGVRRRDLIIAGETEVAKLQGGDFNMIRKLFTLHPCSAFK